MSVYADEGTAAHTVLEQCLKMIYDLGMDPTVIRAKSYIGQSIVIPADEDGDHALLGPSGAKGWMTCGQWAQMALKYPEAKQPERTVTFAEDYADAVQVCLDYVATRVALIREYYGPVTVRTERRVSSERFTGHNETDGTADITLIADGYCEQIDFKGGAGVAVYANDPQNAWYFLGVCAEYAKENTDPSSLFPTVLPFYKARLTVVQPRCDKVSPTIRWIDIDNVLEWHADFLGGAVPAIENALNPDAPFVPSEEACRWCKAGGSAKYSGAPTCEAYAAHCLKEIGLDIDDGNVFGAAVDLTSTDPAVLDEERVVKMLDIREMISGMFTAVEANALDRLNTGLAGPLLSERYKLVRGRSNRKFAQPEKETVARLKKIKFADPEGALDSKGEVKERCLKKAEMYESKLCSLATLEGKLKGIGIKPIMWEAFKAMIEKPPGKLTIAPADDARKAVDPQCASPEESFADVPLEAPTVDMTTKNPAT